MEWSVTNEQNYESKRTNGGTFYRRTNHAVWMQQSSKENANVSKKIQAQSRTSWQQKT